ncbi:rod shape-determining protein MreC [Aequorivita echinoideorum]|uniref:Cell shape-determining protein MreC n=1 Tax=Aequorivita echinoideorum TaxID=1549647 RepID=A0ABS5S671_9FLAO|nr:rod shape-determining protein MreC [Aequorivita echinoideorum]MBT0607315.1 rod shape-determining protein MreC [Aequorivita echinoideorum]
MQQIIFFFIRNKNFLLFAVLFVISLGLTIQTHNYHNNKYISSANYITGGIFTFKNNVTDYFSLGRENELLQEENVMLRQELEKLKKNASGPELDTTLVANKFEYFTARVINNNYAKTKNQLTLDKGERDSISIDLGVISSKGLVGIVSDVSNKYATVQSILNTKSRINAKLKKSSHFGSLVWNTKDPNIAQLVDIPRLAKLEKGDTIITGGRSTIFPEGILIGTIRDFRLDEDDNYYYVNIDLFNDMTSLEHVYLIKNNDAREIIDLEKGVEDAEQ